MDKHQRWTLTSLRAAESLPYKHYRFVSIAVKGGSVLGFGYNNPYKGSKIIKYPKKGLHSEVNLCLQLGKKALVGANIYVAGVSHAGNIPTKGCKPCVMCQEVLASMPINDVYYLDADGLYKRL